MWHKIKPIVVKEFRQVRRDKRTLGILFVFPAFMLILFGYAITFDVKHIPLAVYDEDQTETSRTFINNFLNSEYFDYVITLHDRRQVDELVDQGVVRVVMVIPRKFGEDVHARRAAPVQFVIDGSNAQAAATTAGYISAIIQNYSLAVLADMVMRSGRVNISLPLDMQPRVWYNPELKSARFLIPGLIGFIMMITAVISTALSVVREKERGTMEQILVSPIRPMELVLGKTITYIFISLVATAIILVVGYLLFGVVVRGNYLTLFVVVLIFLFDCLGLGLFISTIAQTQQVAFMLSALLTLLPTFLLSGFVFPIKNMPIAIQAVTYLIPARYFLVALRGIILKGVGFAAFWDQVLFLVAFGIIVITVSVVKMKKTQA
jgi:ABC-2 type transport system permease protein